MNWLKWETLNETLSPELRITAFQSLKHCCEEESEIVATLITQRDSHPQGFYNTACCSGDIYFYLLDYADDIPEGTSTFILAQKTQCRILSSFTLLYPSEI